MNASPAQRSLTIIVAVALLIGALITAFPFLWMLCLLYTSPSPRDS